MRATVVNSYSYWNAGDAAIMISTAELLRDLHFSEVSLSTRYDTEVAEYDRWRIRVDRALIAFPVSGHRAWRVLVFLLDLAVTVVLLKSLSSDCLPKACRRLLVRLRPRLRSAMSADAIVIAGGGYLYTSKRRINLSLWHSCFSVWVSKQLGPAIYMMPNSVGPISRRSDQVLVDYCFRGVRTVVREELSLANCSFPLSSFENAELLPDIAFYSSCAAGIPDYDYSAEGMLESSSRSSRLVRVVCMDWRWSSSARDEVFGRYVSELASACDRLVRDGFRVVLGGHSAIPDHGQDDIEVCRLVSRQMTENHDIDENCDVGHLWSAYRESALVIGTRLHACIMAIAQGTPAVALAYQEKTLGVLGSSHWNGHCAVVRVDDFDAAMLVRSALSLDCPPQSTLDSVQGELRAYYG